MVDNSQGHSAYAEDALLASRMNLRSGGKQARLRDGWFVQDGKHITQQMNFPPDHPKTPGVQKGIRQILVERNLWSNDLNLDCSKPPDPASPRCCARHLLASQPDFQQQRSLVQEVIEDAGHLCIFLPKFHCELNFIEFFWGAVKRYLREHCDYTFGTLKENLPKAMMSVGLNTIRRWDHRSCRWREAYQSGLGPKEAQLEVKLFSSKRYTSHRRIPETVARHFDQ